ncbi:K(+)/H(+) antiporter subunit E [Caenibius tardaugens NBRC 16725]|uniref:K(+)/H(+) antiporter subunit E n=1 Tax=Caenibius tardaugens NBRC 16725 TaxID=1219035 RepID=U2ZXN4_9SPHN|nr:Na+/H+ antiporter subunit E [Caenibius tardaugens]AZI35558.1 Na+/H+ antiporter subunit E [Caenibius tardaugens NBRC 16725]GAD50159.1 K(+)/H(+) antiporter subunit E [Caenibius tardaugens NBRC 16725]
MTRWVPYPMLSASLLLMWVLLTQSSSVGQLLLGSAVSLFSGQVMSALRPGRVKIRSLRPLPKLLGLVIVDIIRSNLAVAKIILLPGGKRISGFVTLPLDMRNEHGLAVLAVIITATPGTMWVQYDRAKQTLLVHVLDNVDEDAWIALIKGRYEALLVEMFGP